MSAIEPGAVRAERAADRRRDLRRARHVVEAVEGEHEVEARRRRGAPRRGRRGTGRSRAPASARLLLGAGDRVRSRARSRGTPRAGTPRELEQRDAAAAADVRHPRAPLEALAHALEARRSRAGPGRSRYQGAKPRSMPARALGPERVVGEADGRSRRPRAAARAPPCVWGSCENMPAAEGRMRARRRAPPRPSGESAKRSSASQSRSRAAPCWRSHSRSQRSSSPVRSASSALVAGPASERAVEAEAVAEVDHAGGHRALQRAEHALRELLEPLDLDRSVAVHAGPPRAPRGRAAPVYPASRASRAYGPPSRPRARRAPRSPGARAPAANASTASVTA